MFQQSLRQVFSQKNTYREIEDLKLSVNGLQQHTL